VVDIFTGIPAKFIGNFMKSWGSKSSKSSKNTDGNIDETNSNFQPVSTVLIVYGTIIGSIRTIIDNIDVFIGKYMFISTLLYIGFKFVHYKLF
jgi:hypothetical protein